MSAAPPPRVTDITPLAPYAQTEKIQQVIGLAEGAPMAMGIEQS